MTIKKPLAFFLACTDNLAFAAGNVALSLHKYMPDVDYECVIAHGPLNPRDHAVLKSLPKVRLWPFAFEDSFVETMLVKIPKESRFRSMNAMMALAHFEMFKLLDEYSFVSWLDLDVSIQADISGIVQFAPFGITVDSYFTIQNNFVRPIKSYDMTAPGFCTAVIVVSDQLPYKALYDWCYKKAVEYADTLINPDQAIINLAFQEFGITPNLMPVDVWQCRPDWTTAITANIVHFGYIKKTWNDEVICNSLPEWYRMHREWQKRGGSDFPRTFEPTSIMPVLVSVKNHLPIEDRFLTMPFKSASSRFHAESSDAHRRLEEIENSTTWRALSGIRKVVSRIPMLRRAVKLLYWTATFQIVSRCKQWYAYHYGSTCIQTKDAALQLQEDYRLNNIVTDIVRRAQIFCKAGRDLEASNLVAYLVRKELWADIWRLDMVFRVIDLWPEAETILLKALKERPLNPYFHDILGLIYIEQRKLDAAIMHFKASVTAAPTRAANRINLAAALLFAGRAEESIDVSRSAMTLTSEFYVYLILASALEKRDGNIKEASKALAAGFGADPKSIGQKDDLRNKNVLLNLTMGAGDIIIALPVVEALAARGARVLLQVDAPRAKALERLLYSCPGVADIVSSNEAMPHIDYSSGLYGYFLDSGSPVSTKPYLTPYQKDVEVWKKRLANVTGLKVGIVWAGDTQASWRGFRVLAHVQRQCSLKVFGALADIPGISLISLQKGPPASQIKGCGLPIIDLTDHINDYADTAALIANLDLVISVDTSVAHLAGAMGKPVWNLLHYDTMFFFWDNPNTTSWYPSMRLFRQPSPGDWDGVFKEVLPALREEVAS